MQTIRTHSSREFRNAIVGKTIAGVVARAGRKGEPPMVMMLQFEDGNVVEFVSPRSDRLLRDALHGSARGRSRGEDSPAQMSLAVA
ncbi:MAG: hypothetical protein ACNA7E_00780 [Wenzhouxiangellaceae bacterium]